MSILIKEGDSFLDFELIDQRENKINLASYKGKNLIVYFYPKDNTKGCTSEACDFRDRLDFFKQENCEVIGISPDSLKSHQKFSSKYELNFSILVDEEHKLSEKLGVWTLKKNYGREYYGIVRSTFIIDKTGIVRKIYKNVRVKDHAEKVLTYIKENLS